jgi:protein TonB
VSGIDAASHGLHLIQFKLAGAGPLSTTRCADPVRRTDLRPPVGKWSAAAFAVSLLAHVAAVMLLLLLRTSPLAVPLEPSFQLVFESPVSSLETSAARNEPSVAEAASLVPPPQPPASAAVPDNPQTLQMPEQQTPEQHISEPQAGELQTPPMPVAPQLQAAPVPTSPGMQSHTRPTHHAAPSPTETRQAPPAQAAASQPLATAVLVPPSPLAGMETNRAPIYPPSSLRRREQGNVMLRVKVSADGMPLAVDLAETSGYPSLDNAAEAAVRQWRFVAATRAGRPVAAVAYVPVRFRLGN